MDIIIAPVFVVPVLAALSIMLKVAREEYRRCNHPPQSFPLQRNFQLGFTYLDYESNMCGAELTILQPFDEEPLTNADQMRLCIVLTQTYPLITIVEVQLINPVAPYPDDNEPLTAPLSLASAA